MRIALMIPEENNKLIEQLKKDVEKIKRIKRWKRATKLIVKHDDETHINKEFQRLLKKD